MKNVTMRDIGAKLGVSTVTISKALSGKDGVSDVVREKIIETAKQMGYHYASSAAETDNGAVIGILTPDRSFSAPSFYSDMYRALLRELTDVGMLGVLEIVSQQDEMAQNMPATMTIQHANGFVLMGQFSEDYVQAMLDAGHPTVLLDFSFDGPDVDAVVSDGQSGTFQLTRYLIDHGHKEIGFVGNIHRTSSIMDRYSGYLRAMTLSGLVARPEFMFTDMVEKNTYLTDYTWPDPMPTALVCNNDILALNIAEILKKRGLRIPEDVSIVGFDDYIGMRESNPFTTYAVDQQHMAQVTVRRLQARMRDGMEGPLRTSVGGWLVERSSVMDLNTGCVCGTEPANHNE